MQSAQYVILWMTVDASGAAMKNRNATFRSNVKLARTIWGELSLSARRALKELTEKHCLSVAERRPSAIGWPMVHNARRLACAYPSDAGVVESERPSKRNCRDPTVGRWVFKATVYKSPRSKGFVGYGDADPLTCRRLSTAPRCAWPKPAPSTAPSERPTASASARSRNSVGRPESRTPSPRVLRGPARPETTAMAMVTTTVSLVCATVSAF